MSKEVRLKEMEREREKEEREIQMQREAREHEFRLKQLELGVIKASDPKIGLDTGGFDVSKHVKFVPKFQEDNVEKFFNHFEKLGEQLKWPRDKWSILIQSNFTGKAQEVYSALSIEDSMDYDKVKKAILQAYELVPEAYRQKFRKYRKADTQTYVEFAYQKERHFDRWCASKKVSTFDTLRQLMLVEEFKRCVNDDIKTHLEENKADKLSEVANLADQYALTHKFSKVGQTQNKGQFSRPNKKYGNNSGTNSGTTGNSGSQSGSISPTNSGKKQPESSRQKNDQASSNKAAFKDITCGFCHKKGHTMANCFTLAKLKETETASNALANVENSSEMILLGQNLIEHDVDVGDATPIQAASSYRVNPRKRQHLRDERLLSSIIHRLALFIIRLVELPVLRYSTLQVYYRTIVNVGMPIPPLGPDQANIN
ncbi:hypothetical protein HOLleu_44514 [Holothuria leucospilota]|uniref:SCAN box domain-containing protein n=1 Tax=Holothuria leucospilota TaxID=206669 RepID=A0A9Q0YD65_HOLLE|nr:hypothetical protein HOLleu_44514 [Holothuria leucospilota]